MAFGFIFSVAFIIAMLIGAFLIYRGVKTRGNAIRIVGIVVAIAGLLGIATIPGSFHTVEAGEIAVVKHLGEAKNVRTAGTYFDFWLTETYEIYDAKVQNMEIQAQAYSKDA